MVINVAFSVVALLKELHKCYGFLSASSYYGDNVYFV